LSKGVLGLLSLYPHSALLAHLPVPIWDAQVEMPLPVAWVIIVRVWLCTLLSIFYFLFYLQVPTFSGWRSFIRQRCPTAYLKIQSR
jgi:hypothetical protein